ncbi:MAG TPA: hypothetical protein VJB16_05505 [archaeon]|nr:hypothetical protein [archaeon]
MAKKKLLPLPTSGNQNKALAAALAIVALLIAVAGNWPAGVLFLVVAGVFAAS